MTRKPSLRNKERTMTEGQEQLIETLNGAAQGISAAVDQQTVTATQIH